MALFAKPWTSTSATHFPSFNITGPLLLRTLLILILLIVTSLVLICVYDMLRRSEAAGWTSARRLAGRSGKDLKGMSASFRYAGMGAKMGGWRGEGGGDRRRERDGDEIDVGDTCAVM